MADEQVINDAKRWIMKAIRLDIRDTAGWTGRDHFLDAVIQAMKAVPRHTFIEDIEPYYAYAN